MQPTVVEILGGIAAILIAIAVFIRVVSGIVRNTNKVLVEQINSLNKKQTLHDTQIKDQECELDKFRQEAAVWARQRAFLNSEIARLREELRGRPTKQQLEQRDVWLKWLYGIVKNQGLTIKAQTKENERLANEIQKLMIANQQLSNRLGDQEKTITEKDRTIDTQATWIANAREFMGLLKINGTNADFIQLKGETDETHLEVS